jgi:hypothetical protein
LIVTPVNIEIPSSSPRMLKSRAIAAAHVHAVRTGSAAVALYRKGRSVRQIRMVRGCSQPSRSCSRKGAYAVHLGGTLTMAKCSAPAQRPALVANLETVGSAQRLQAARSAAVSPRRKVCSDHRRVAHNALGGQTQMLVTRLGLYRTALIRIAQALLPAWCHAQWSETRLHEQHVAVKTVVLTFTCRQAASEFWPGPV